MFARVTELRGVDEADRHLQHFEDDILPQAEKVPGMSGGLVLVDRAEYKRRQAAPGVKLRPRAFGRDRRTPITNRWRG